MRSHTSWFLLVNDLEIIYSPLFIYDISTLIRWCSYQILVGKSIAQTQYVLGRYMVTSCQSKPVRFLIPLHLYLKSHHRLSTIFIRVPNRLRTVFRPRQINNLCWSNLNVCRHFANATHYESCSTTAELAIHENLGWCWHSGCRCPI